MKLKALLYTSIFCITSFGVFAQKDTGSKAAFRHFISVNAGASMPNGDFSAPYSAGLGSAVSGFTGSLFGFMGRGNSSTGFAAMLNYNQNQVNTSNLFSGNKITKAGTYTEAMASLGLCLDIPMKKFFLDFRFMIGPAMATSPTITYVNGNENYTIGQSTTYSASADLGIGLRYAITKSISLSLFADNFWAAPKYSPSENGSKYSVSSNIVLSNYSAGIAFSFGKYAGPPAYIPSYVDSIVMDSGAKISYPKAYISLNAGLDIPRYKFQCVNSSGVGAATNGTAYNVYGYIPLKHSDYGIAVMAGAGTNGFSSVAYNSWLTHTTGYLAVTTAGSPSQFTELYGAIGGYMSMDFYSATLDFRAMVGGLDYSTPDISYSTYQQGPILLNPPPVYTAHTPSRSAVALATDIGVSLRINFLKRFFIVLNVDLLNTPADAVSVINATGGLGFRL